MSTPAVEERVDELLARMTLEEKVGLMFHAPIFMNPDGTLLDDTEERIAGRHLNHFNIYFAPEPRQHAEWHNRLQDLAEDDASRDPRDDLFRPAAQLCRELRRSVVGHGFLAMASADWLRRARRRGRRP